MVFNAIEQQLQYHENQINILEEMRNLAEQYEQGEGDFTEEFSSSGRGGSNRGGRNLNNDDDSSTARGNRGTQGRRNFADSNDSEDGRTLAGRQNDDDEFSDRELRGFLRNPPMEATNEDGSFDKRTKIGRALEAAGMIDDEGFPVSPSRGRSHTTEMSGSR